MNSKDILPDNKRLDKWALLQLEGKTARSFHTEFYNLPKLILDYHNALLASEKTQGEELSIGDFMDKLRTKFPNIEMVVNLDELERFMENYLESNDNKGGHSTRKNLL